MNSEQLREKWNEWCEGFFKLKQHEMSRELTTAMLNMTLNEGHPVPEQVTESFPYRVMMAHANRIGLNATPPVIAFISLGVASGNPGTAVMYAHALRFMQLKRKLDRIDMQALCTHAFPMGFPTTADLGGHWDKQKGYLMGEPFDNMLDTIGILT